MLIIKEIEMEKKTKWIYGDDENHYYEKNLITKIWNEILNNKIINSFQIHTYNLDKIILKNQNDAVYVELGDTQAIIVFEPIENLDSDDKSDGYWEIITSYGKRKDITIDFMFQIK